ncbi:hypothetical protein M2D63_023020 [Pseudomonas sp. BJa5]|uniref:hypothetical protein n=1 Tax=Pseudomonas sp. BJa5 TaxID=2936270 RepID=UPI002559D692|nr:hypothetical protein [Pseudomonas sp. BGr12]MDL2423991.1 hypothetical protein [Pseudomonas sp. BGr12]
MTNGTESTPIRIDGKVATPSAVIEELDEQVPGFWVTRERYPLHKDARVYMERWLQSALEDWEDAGESDEIVVWSRSSAVGLSQQDNQLTLRIDDQDYLITPSSPAQRLTLQLMKSELPPGLGEGISWPLRIDSAASSSKSVAHTEDPGLQIYGTPQFQFRVLSQLALLDGNKELKALLDDSRQSLGDRHTRVLIMELYVQEKGRFGPTHSTFNREGDVALLYNPYQSSESGLELFKLLYRLFTALATPSPLP